jgi:hypothetical protein
LQPHKLPVTDKKSKKNKKKKKSVLIKQSASEQKKKIRAEKHEKIRLKKEKSLKNTLHEQAVSDTKQIVMKIVNNSIHLAEEREKNVAFSKSIVNGMLDRAIQISDTKKIVMKIVENSIHVAEEHAKNLAFSKPIVNGILDRVIQLSEEKKLSEKKVNSLPKPFIQPSPPPNHISLLKTIMTDAEFKTFDLLIGKIPSTSARIWMTGSSVILYFLNQHKIYHKLFNNDIDIQIYTSMKNLQQIQRIVVESDFEYKTASVEKGYMQFISKNKDKNTRGLDVTIINQDIYQPTYDPIEITRCKLEVFRRAQDHYSCYYDSDENVRYLHTAFSDSSENLLKINLTGDISNTERLFLRIIKNTKKYGTMLTQKLILAEQKNNGSYHSEWKKWLVSYFKNLQLTKSDSHYKEFDVLLKDCCFDNWRDILLTFFEILLGADRTSLAPANMVSIFYNFYDTYFCDQPLKSVIHEILEIVKGNSKLLTAQLSEFNLTTILIQLGQKLGCVLKTGPEVELETEVRERGFRRG